MLKKAILILLALLAIRFLPRALRREARTMELLLLLFQLVAKASASNTAMTYANGQRTGDLETRVGNLEQGIFPNVHNLGYEVTFETDRSCTMDCSGLAAITTLASPTTGGSWDPNSGPNWGSGEREYINGLYDWIISFQTAATS